MRIVTIDAGECPFDTVMIRSNKIFQLFLMADTANFARLAFPADFMSTVTVNAGRDRCVTLFFQRVMEAINKRSLCIGVTGSAVGQLQEFVVWPFFLTFQDSMTGDTIEPLMRCSFKISSHNVQTVRYTVSNRLKSVVIMAHLTGLIILGNSRCQEEDG
jgi:hypothetical protein